MPTYAYKCPSCGHEYQKIQKMTDNSRAKCPECGVRGERVITGGGGFIFKGSGFYITDYKRGGGKEPAADGGGDKKEKDKKPPSETAEVAKTPKTKKGEES